MAEKAIFLILCLNVPLFLAEIFLLFKAGIPLSWSLVPGLLFLQLEFLVCLTFPAAVLAAITETLVQWILAVVGILVFALFVSSLPWSKLPTTLTGDENISSNLGFGIIVPILAFALLWRYARRRVWPARLAAGAAVLVVPLIVLFASTPIARVLAYPPPHGVTSLQLSLAPNESGAGRTYGRNIQEYRTDPNILIPITASPTEPDTIVQVEGWRVTLSGDNGWRWQSPWFSESINTGGETGQLVFTMPVALADQLAQKHATARADVAFAVYHLGATQRIETTAERFLMPGGGVCHWSPHRASFVTPFRFVISDLCVVPLKLPDAILIEMESKDSTCARPEGEPPIDAGHQAYDFECRTDSLPAEFDPNPVRSLSITMSSWTPPVLNPRNPRENLPAAFCRGLPSTCAWECLPAK
jgi:hypothetical protein